MAHSVILAARTRPLENATVGIRVAGIAAFALLAALGAFIRIPLPFTPVPVTLQTFFVLMAGVYLGGRDGAASQLLYLGIGATGLPIFAGGAGLAHLAGPTAGYLLSFPIAAWIVGATVRPGTPLLKTLSMFLVAKLVIFGLGAAWLGHALGLDVRQAIALGVVPFLPGTVLKVAAATALVVRPPFTR